MNSGDCRRCRKPSIAWGRIDETDAVLLLVVAIAAAIDWRRVYLYALMYLMV